MRAERGNLARLDVDGADDDRVKGAYVQASAKGVGVRLTSEFPTPGSRGLAHRVPLMRPA